MAQLLAQFRRTVGSESFVPTLWQLSTPPANSRVTKNETILGRVMKTLLRSYQEIFTFFKPSQIRREQSPVVSTRGRAQTEAEGLSRTQLRWIAQRLFLNVFSLQNNWGK
jgi:hypothetical protein